jgi:hypothetical protein
MKDHIIPEEVRRTALMLFARKDYRLAAELLLGMAGASALAQYAAAFSGTCSVCKAPCVDSGAVPLVCGACVFLGRR